SEPSPTNRPDATVNRLRLRLQNVSVARERRLVGPAELIALGCSALMVLLVVVSYLYFLVPARSRLDSLQSERSRLQKQLSISTDLATQGQTTQAAVQKITESLDDFE